MMSSIFYVVVLIVLMMIGGFISPIVLNLGGLLGGLISMKPSSEQRRDFLWILGLVITLIGQCFVALAWVALIITYVRYASSQPNVWSWLLWIVGFFTAISLTSAASRATLQEERTDIEYAEKAKFNVQHIAVPITGIIGVIAFFIFAFVPSVMSGLYGWLPYVE